MNYEGEQEAGGSFDIAIWNEDERKQILYSYDPNKTYTEYSSYDEDDEVIIDGDTYSVYDARNACYDWADQDDEEYEDCDDYDENE